MTAEQIFEEVRKVETLAYKVVLTSDSCQVYDMLDPEPGWLGNMVIDADFHWDMFDNAKHGLEGLYEERLKKAQEDGTYERRLKYRSRGR
jgi:inosine/xanthosine triphosphate pyrophosphatase family protein